MQKHSWARRLVSWEGPAAGLALAAGLFSDRLVMPAFGLLLLFWPLRRIARGRFSVRTPLDLAILPLAVSAVIALWVSAQPEVSRLQFERLALGVGLFYALINWADRPLRTQTPVEAGILLGVGLALAALISVEWTLAKLPFIPAGAYESFRLLLPDGVHPNVMAGSLALLLPLAMARLLWGWRIDRPWRFGLMLAAVGMMGVVLVLTQSRGGLIAAAVSSLALIALRWRRGWLGFPIGGLLAGLVLWAAASRPGGDRLISGLLFDELNGRLEFWSRAIFMIQDFSFSGVGLGLYVRAADLLYPFLSAEPGSVPHAHNLFLQIGVDLGVPGLIAWLGAYLLACTTAWRVYRAGKAGHAGRAAGLGAGLLAGQLALAVHGMLDAVTWGMVRPALLVWALWGLSAAAWRVQSTRRPQAAPPVQ